MRHRSIFALPADLPDAERHARRHALMRLSLAWHQSKTLKTRKRVFLEQQVVPWFP